MLVPAFLLHLNGERGEPVMSLNSSNMDSYAVQRKYSDPRQRLEGSTANILV